jgi:hypothetical protein
MATLVVLRSAVRSRISTPKNQRVTLNRSPFYMLEWLVATAGQPWHETKKTTEVGLYAYVCIVFAFA